MRKIIRTDGTEEDVPEPIGMDEIARRIGAQTVDAVALRHMGRPLHVMSVDDAGHETEAVEVTGGIQLRPIAARKPVNEKATALYHANCIPGTTHKIVGDVFICPDDDFAIDESD